MPSGRWHTSLYWQYQDAPPLSSSLPPPSCETIETIETISGPVECHTLLLQSNL
jgi:hypothetical protein